jgi:hypothetical protein
LSPLHAYEKLNGTFIQLSSGFEWNDYEGLFAGGMSDFNKWVQAEFMNKCELPPAFSRAFEDNHPMAFTLSGLTQSGYDAYVFLLHIPSVDLLLGRINNSESTIADMMNRLVIVYVPETPSGGYIKSYHKHATDELPWLVDLKKSWKDTGGTAAQCLANLIAAATSPYRGILEDYRRHIDVLVERDYAMHVTCTINMLSLLNRQAQVLKRSLRANFGAVEELADKEEKLLRPVLHTIEDIRHVAEEIESNAADAMNLRMALCAFQSQQHMKFFTYLSAIVSPLALMTGWYGMNFQAMPEIAGENAYWIFIAVAVMVVVLMCLGLVYMNRASSGRNMSTVELAHLAGYRTVVENPSSPGLPYGTLRS